MLKGCSKIILMLPLFSMALDAGEIKGAIRDGKTHEPVIGASVFLRSSVLPAEGLNVLSEDGNYRFPNLKAGTYTVSADFAGAKAESTVTITDEQTQDVALTVNMAAAQAATYKIETTGTRLPTAASHAISPVTSIDAGDIVAQGSTRIEDVVNSMPQAFAAQGSTVSNGSNGTATVNLRNLGSNRSLILIDGRRLGPGNPSSTTPAVGDVNFIPAPLIERVDVLTGGSSAVYGADAVAGVVNFITKKNFEGVQFDLGWDFYQHGQQNKDIQALIAARGQTNPSQFVVPGNTWQPMGPSASLMIGINSADGKGNVTAYGSYRRDFGILQKDYDYSACSLESGATFTCGGSSTASPPNFLDLTNGNFWNIDGTTNIIRPRNTATDLFNFGPLNYFQRPDERWNLGGMAHYQLAPWAEVYAQGMYMNDVSVGQVAPGGDFFQNNATAINCGNPLLQANTSAYRFFCGGGPAVTTPGSLVGGFYPLLAPGAFAGPTQPAGGPNGVLVGKRNVEGGPRDSSFAHDAFRHVFGLKGDIGKNWSYDAYHSYHLTDFVEVDTGFFNINKLNNAFNVVPASGLFPTLGIADGTPVCASVQNGTDLACVPYNVFTNGQVTQAQTDYLQDPGIFGGRIDERIVNASISGNLTDYGIRSPLACDGVALNAGGEYRRQQLTTYVDGLFRSSLLSGEGSAPPPTDAAVTAAEGFAEVRVPLVQDLTAIKMLQVEGAYRYSNYSFTNNLLHNTQHRDSHTYKVGGLWEFMDNMRVRGSYQRAVRVPNIVELFGPATVGIDGATDPCALAGVAGVTPAQLAACDAAFPTTTTALGAGWAGSNPVSTAAQYNGLTGGNPDLQPELSDTWSVGVFLQPNFVPGLQVSVDYFNISINQAIATGADFILKACLANPAEMSNVPGKTWCQLVTRDNAALGSIFLTNNGFVSDIFQNQANRLTDGIDIFVGYDLDTKTFGGSDWGRLYLAFNGTWINRLTDRPLPGGDSFNCVGLFGNLCSVDIGSGPTPAWRHKARLTWDTWFGLSVAAQWRMISGMSLDAYSAQPLLNTPAQQFPTDQYLGARHYLDLFASYDWNNMLTLRFGVNNVIDQDPPLIGLANNPIAGGGNGNTIPQAYDALGRHFFMSGTVKF